MIQEHPEKNSSRIGSWGTRKMLADCRIVPGNLLFLSFRDNSNALLTSLVIYLASYISFHILQKISMFRFRVTLTNGRWKNYYRLGKPFVPVYAPIICLSTTSDCKKRLTARLPWKKIRV